MTKVWMFVLCVAASLSADGCVSKRSPTGKKELSIHLSHKYNGEEPDSDQSEFEQSQRPKKALHQNEGCTKEEHEHYQEERY